MARIGAWRGRRRRSLHLFCALMALMFGWLVSTPSSVQAGHWAASGWSHDHSSSGIPIRPKGLNGLNNRFGGACSAAANDAVTWFPSAVDRNVGGYVYYHPYLAVNVGNNIRGHIGNDHREGAVDYGVYGYDCRLKTGGTQYSTHAWGAAIDTNTARNPYGQTYWNGIGADGLDHGSYIPNVWKGPNPGHRLYWGLNFSGTKDPHHFQYVTGY